MEEEEDVLLEGEVPGVGISYKLLGVATDSLPTQSYILTLSQGSD